MLVIPREDKTSTYYKGINRLLCASHWINPQGDERKIPQGLKLYYQYRKGMFETFKYLDCIYYEKHTTVSKVLGLSVDTIKKVYNPMLKDMGLIETKGTFKENNISYIVYDIDNLQGVLINRDLKVCKIKQLESNFTPKEGFSFDNMKKLDHNKKVAKRIRMNSEELMTAITKDRFLELVSYERKVLELERGGNEE